MTIAENETVFGVTRRVTSVGQGVEDLVGMASQTVVGVHIAAGGAVVVARRASAVREEDITIALIARRRGRNTLSVAGEDVGVNTVSAVDFARNAFTVGINDLALFGNADGVLGDAFAVGEGVIGVGAGETVIVVDTIASGARGIAGEATVVDEHETIAEVTEDAFSMDENVTVGSVAGWGWVGG